MHCGPQQSDDELLPGLTERNVYGSKYISKTLVFMFLITTMQEQHYVYVS